MSKADNAKELFLSGYNCAQAVVGAFCEEMGLPFERAVKLVSPYGGGIGRMREVCGAVNAMFLVLGAVEGYAEAEAGSKKAELYKTVQRLAQSFKDINGSIICRELLSNPPSTPTPDARTAEYYAHRTCADKVYDAASIIETFLNSKNA